MIPEGVPAVWRGIKRGCTRTFSAETIQAEFSNPGNETIFVFQGRHFWHEPIYDDKRELVGHKLELSLVPTKYLMEFLTQK